MIDRFPVVELEEPVERILYALQPRQLECWNLTPFGKDPDEPYPEHIGYGGAAGGGKSYLARAVCVAAAMRWPGSKTIIFRKTEGEVKENHVNNFRTEVPDEVDGIKLYDWNGDDLCATWWNGSRTFFGYLKHDDDVFRYQGNDYDIIVFEEATHYSWFMISWLTGNRLRSTVDGTRPFCLYPSNPGGKGHFWFKRWFVDRNFYREEGEEPDQYAFVQAKLADNEVLQQRDPRYARRLDRLPEPWRSWQRDGNFAAGAGAMLSEVNRDVHLVSPFEVPAHWTRFGSFDWGYWHPWVFGEYAVDEDGFVFKLQTITGIRQLPDKIAEAITSRVDVSKLAYVHAGHDSWAERKSLQDNTPVVAEVFEKHGIYMMRANNARVAGLQALKRALEWKDKKAPGIDGRPYLVFFDNPGNRSCITQLEVMTPDPDNLEDVLKVDADEFGRGGDDMYDETRYAISSRPQAADSVEMGPGVEAWAPETLAFEADKQRRPDDELIDVPVDGVFVDAMFGELY